MSGATCTCFSGKSPLGLPECVPSFGKDTVIIFMNERASDGTYNEVKLTDLVDGKLPESFMTTALNNDDQTKQWFMTVPFDEVNPVRSEPITQDRGGNPLVVRQGNLMWTGSTVAPPAYLKALQTHTCGTSTVFFTVDAQGNLKGKKVKNSAGEWVLRGRRIQKGTMYVMYNEGPKDEKEIITMAFQVAETENDADFGFLSSASMGFSMHSLQPIFVSVIETVTAVTTTEWVISVSDQFGTLGQENHVTGLTDADFDLFNETDDASVVISDVVEDDEAKTYTVTFAAQTAGDTLRIVTDKDYVWSEPITGTIPT